jgi:cation transport regulator ChaB
LYLIFIWIIVLNMPIPQTIKKSDSKAQRIWKKTHDSAKKTYGKGSRANRVAYASLKHQYRKEGDRWVRKDFKGPSDPQAARGPKTGKRSIDEPLMPTAGGKVAKSRKEAVAKRKDAKSEYQRESWKRRKG